MFLFAKLVCDNLLNQTSRANLYAEMSPDIFPKGLNEAYFVLSRITVHDG